MTVVLWHRVVIPLCGGLAFCPPVDVPTFFCPFWAIKDAPPDLIVFASSFVASLVMCNWAFLKPSTYVAAPKSTTNCKKEHETCSVSPKLIKTLYAELIRLFKVQLEL
jgi:hypothetical protein